MIELFDDSQVTSMELAAASTASRSPSGSTSARTTESSTLSSGARALERPPSIGMPYSLMLQLAPDVINLRTHIEMSVRTGASYEEP